MIGVPANDRLIRDMREQAAWAEFDEFDTRPGWFHCRHCTSVSYPLYQWGLMKLHFLRSHAGEPGVSEC